MDILNDSQTVTSYSNNWSNKFIYHFDYPGILETGYIEIKPDKIILQFPEISKDFSISHSDSVKQYVCLYFNNQLRFSYQWLPIYTLSDLYKVKNMLHKCLTEFQNMYSFLDFTEMYQYCNNQSYCDQFLTEYSDNGFEIKCFEDSNITSLELNMFNKNDNNNNDNVYNSNFLDVKICIGKYKVFSLSEIQTYVKNCDLYYLLYFILYKLVKY